MNSLGQLFKRYRLLRYVFSGGVAFVGEYGSYLLLYYVFKTRINVAADVSYFIGLITSFMLNRQWVFMAHHAKGRHFIRQVTLYGLLIVVNATFTNFAILQLQHHGVKPYSSKLLLVLVITLWNYAIYQKLIFTHRAPHVDDDVPPAAAS